MVPEPSLKTNPFILASTVVEWRWRNRLQPRLVPIQASLLCDFSSFFLIFATQVGHHLVIATPEGGTGGDRGVRAEPKAPPKIEDSKMEALVAIKGKEELCSKCERGPPRTCKIVFMLLLFSFCFLFRK